MQKIPDHQRARQYFDSLTAAEKAEAVRGMADEGHGDYVIAAATQLAVEQVRQLIGERQKQ